jgi:hypothetical protein
MSEKVFYILYFVAMGWLLLKHLKDDKDHRNFINRAKREMGDI